jgi:hypothetical protein
MTLKARRRERLWPRRQHISYDRVQGAPMLALAGVTLILASGNPERNCLNITHASAARSGVPNSVQRRISATMSFRKALRPLRRVRREQDRNTRRLALTLGARQISFSAGSANFAQSWTLITTRPLGASCINRTVDRNRSPTFGLLPISPQYRSCNKSGAGSGPGLQRLGSKRRESGETRRAQCTAKLFAACENLYILPMATRGWNIAWRRRTHCAGGQG